MAHIRENPLARKLLFVFICLSVCAWWCFCVYILVGVFSFEFVLSDRSVCMLDTLWLLVVLI